VYLEGNVCFNLLFILSKTPKGLDMPTPFMCHGCDKPTMNKNGVCDDCIKKENKKKNRSKK